MTIFSKHNTPMDSQLFNRKLAKISLLVDNTDQGSPLSTLERDLLLSYIRELYDLALEGKVMDKAGSMVPKSPVSAPVSMPTPAPLVAPKEVAVSKPIEEPMIEKIVSQPVSIPEPVRHAPVIEEKIEVMKPIVVEESVEKPKQVEIVQISSPQPLSAGLANTSEAVRELFVVEEVHDLSEKLSLTPIKDLTKSMGINERVLMLHELFGNNKELFAETLERLNGLTNFDEASQYLIQNIIPKYDWTADKRVKAASQFIKLVRRRYL
jgi:hypothetical protein